MNELLSTVGLESLGDAALFEHLKQLTIVNPLPLVHKGCLKSHKVFFNLESFVLLRKFKKHFS